MTLNGIYIQDVDPVGARVLNCLRKVAKKTMVYGITN